MSTEHIFKIACFITGFQFLLFAIFLLTHKKGKKPSNRILSVLLLAKFFGIANVLVSIVYVKYLYLNFPHLFFVGFSFLYLLGPSFYFYTKSMSYKDFSFKKSHILHLVPFLIHSVYMILNYHIHSAETKRHILEAGIIHESTTGLLFVVALNVIILIYLIASLRIMANYQQRIKEEFSNTRRIDLSWLRFLLLGFCLIWILDVTHFFVSLAQDSYPHNLSIAVLGLLFIYANSILYFGLKQPAIFNGVKEKSKYKNSNLTLAGIEQYKTKLLEFMEKEKPYLDPDLKMQDLAESLSIPARHLSQVINDKLGQNFFDFVSSYRIKEAKKHLIDKNNGNTVLEILYDAGFNAKSTFNNIFKKKTGLTPTQYKRQHTSETG